MPEKYFLTQVKHTNGNWEKGCVIKDSLNDARQSYHAYLGAYGYGHDAKTDYVMCYIVGDNGSTFDSMVDDRRQPIEPDEADAS